MKTKHKRSAAHLRHNPDLTFETGSEKNDKDNQKSFEKEKMKQLKVDREFQALFKNNPMLYWASQEIFTNQP